MNLAAILIFSAIALLIRLLFVDKGRKWLIFFVSLLAIFWLQPISPIRYFDFWFPIGTIALVTVIWLLVTPAEEREFSGVNIISLLSLPGIVLLLALTRYIGFENVFLKFRPPQIPIVILVLVIFGLIGFILLQVKQTKKWSITIAIVFILLLFLCLKVPWLAHNSSIALRLIMKQSTTQASGLDLRWLGFSYVAFRLIHILRDSQKGRGKKVSLRDFFSYVIFFPSFTAGPIDRLERFLGDLESQMDRSPEVVLEGGQRLVIGLFKKFVIADTLALISLNGVNAPQLNHIGWSWVVLYAYSFQILFDFSGYTDIAIGIGQFVGIKLPENFNRPYLQKNLTTFWNNWHMTLTNWFRAYFFNPLTRSMRKAGKFSQTAILLVTQLGTMILIGMWHGVTWNFLFWGLWHGIGLFIQNRWSDWARQRLSWVDQKPWLQKSVSVINVLITFHYVTLGWVWFALPDPMVSISILKTLLDLT